MRWNARGQVLAVLALVCAVASAASQDSGRWGFDPTESPKTCQAERPLPLCGDFFAERARIFARFGGVDSADMKIEARILQRARTLATCWFRYNGYLNCGASGKDACLLVLPAPRAAESQLFFVSLVYPSIARPLLECLDPSDGSRRESRWGWLPVLGAHVSVALRHDNENLIWLGGGERFEALAPCAGMEFLCSAGWFPELCR